MLSSRGTEGLAFLSLPPPPPAPTLKDNYWELERVRGGGENLDSTWASMLSHLLMGLSSHI